MTLFTDFLYTNTLLLQVLVIYVYFCRFLQKPGNTLCLKNDTDVAHYNLDRDQPILIILAEMLLREYAIKRSFVIPPLPTNVSALPGET